MQNSLILCPTARLVRAIQMDTAQTNSANGITQWRSAPVNTLLGWLEGMIESEMLAGTIAPPQTLLAPFNEQCLWEDVITQSLKKNAFGDLFDVSGLASAAMQANQYIVEWKLHIPRDQISEESRQFLQWQRAFVLACNKLNVLESVRYFDWQLDCLEQGRVGLPEHIAFAGFDQTAPQERRFREILSKRGVQVSDYVTTLAESASTHHFTVDNQEAECRAAVAWAQASLMQNPKAKLAIVAPQLSEVRNQLADLLDDTFYPASIRPGWVDTIKNYNFSLGTPLIQQPIIQAALNLLRILNSYQLQQADISAVLLSLFWSANQQEADACALLDAQMREQLPMQLSLTRFIEFATKQYEHGLNIVQLLAHLNAAMAISRNRTMPSQWAQTLSLLLATLNWPGERSITSLEFQVISAWQKALLQLGKLDVLGKNCSPSEAVQGMQKICSESIFQAETTNQPSIQIVGIMEALSAPVDAMWCMQMNDHIWPLPAHPNPLLPAFIQRAASVPGADNHIQAAFAATIQQRLLHSANTIIFSSSKTEGESQLRISPLITNIPVLENTALASTLAEQLSQLNFSSSEFNSSEFSSSGNAVLTKMNLECLDDHIAPAIQAGEHVSGGTGLFKAQAICPAWAFYQYRLGAKALKTPSNGLDNMDRGSLIHSVLEQFWHPSEQYRHFADLRDMTAESFAQAINTAIRHTLQDFAEHNNIASKALLTLEHERLYKLVAAWLQYEKEHGVSFKIIDCEAERKVAICGIEITLKVDRIQQFENGGLAFIDYKTGQEPKMTSWDAERITEPQLPIYAAFGGDNSQISSVQFAWVKIVEHAFIGVSSDNFEAKPDKRKPKFIQQFDNWQSLLDYWKTSIEAIAQEIKMGEATVKFNHENDLMYCEVLPLLRLPERQLQFERFQKSSGQKDQSQKGSV